MATYHFRKDGNGSGGSWDDAAPIDLIDGMLAAAQPDDVFLIGTDRRREDPVFWSDTLFRLTASGAPSDPLRITFGLISHAEGVVKARPGTGQTQFRNSGIGFLERIDPERFGDPLAIFQDGASNIALAGPVFFGAPASGLIRFSSGERAFENIVLSDIHGQMAGRVIETEQSSVLRDITVERCSVSGAMRGFARFHNLSRSRLRSLEIDASDIDAGQEGDFQGISVVAGSDVTFENISVRNGTTAWGTEAGDDFVQGDGFVCEERTENFTFTSCHALNMGDGGFDLKTSAVRAVSCSAISCKFGFRIWRQSPQNVLDRCVVEAPYSQATNQSACLWVGGNVRVENCRLRGGGLGGAVFRFGEGPDSGERHITVKGGEIAVGTGGFLVRGEPGSVDLDAVVLDGETISARLFWDGSALSER